MSDALALTARALFLRSPSAAALVRRRGRPHHVGLVRLLARLRFRRWLEVGDRRRLVGCGRLTRLGVIFPGRRLLARRPVGQGRIRFPHRGCRHRLTLAFALRSARDCARLTHAATVARTAAATPAATASTPASGALRPVAAVRTIGAGFAGQRGGRWRGSRSRIALGSLLRGSGEPLGPAALVATPIAVAALAAAIPVAVAAVAPTSVSALAPRALRVARVAVIAAAITA